MRLAVRSKWSAKQLAAGLVALLMSFAPVIGIGIAVSGLTLGSAAFAVAEGSDDDLTGDADETDLSTVQEAACNAANIIRGPAGLAIGFLVVVGGIIALQVASRDAMPLIGRGIFGTALLLGAGAAFAAVVSEPCTGVTSLPTPAPIIVEAPGFEHRFEASLAYRLES